MKRELIAAVALTSFLFFAPCARAVNPARSAEDHDVVTARLWKEKIGLSDDQVPNFIAALKANEESSQPLREELRSALRLIQTQLAENAQENVVQNELQQYARLRKAAFARNEQFDVRLASFLTPSQRARFAVWRALGAFRGKSALELGEEIQEPATSEELEPE